MMKCMGLKFLISRGFNPGFTINVNVQTDPLLNASCMLLFVCLILRSLSVLHQACENWSQTGNRVSGVTQVSIIASG